MRKNHPVRLFIKRKLPWLFRPVSTVNQGIRWFFIWRRAGLPLSEELAARLAFRRACRFKALPELEVNYAAFMHIGTRPNEGLAQLAILLHAGCQPHHKVLEVGCGAFNAGYPITQYLERGNFCGIEPNDWAFRQSLEIPEVRQVAEQKMPRFDANDQFDGTCFGEKFDYIISHSILSHAAHWQWPLFMQNVDAVAKPGTKIFASLHFTDGNAYGGPGYAGTELDFSAWVYPGVSWFRQETVFSLAKRYGYRIRRDLVAPMLITSAHPAAIHTWIVLEKKP